MAHTRTGDGFATHLDGTAAALAVLEKRVGRRVNAVRRMRYVHRGAVVDDHGVLELNFSDQVTLCLDAGHDGEKLAVRHGSWIDPFVEPLCEENREVVRTSGKWTAFDIAEDDELWQIVGRTLEGVEPIWGYAHKLVGVRLDVGASTLVARAVADELWLTWEPVGG